LEVTRVLCSRSFLSSTYSAESVIKLEDLLLKFVGKPSYPLGVFQFAIGLGESRPEVVDLLLEEYGARPGMLTGVVARLLPPELVLGYRKTLCSCYALDRR
jgi:hypothetical protein